MYTLSLITFFTENTFTHYEPYSYFCVAASANKLWKQFIRMCTKVSAVAHLNIQQLQNHIRILATGYLANAKSQVVGLK